MSDLEIFIRVLIVATPHMAAIYFNSGKLFRFLVFFWIFIIIIILRGISEGLS